MDHEDESSSGNAGHQNLNDLHNYLTTFNKEIEPVEDVLSTIGVDTEVGDVGDLYTPSASHSLQEPGEVTVAGQFSSGFYTEQGILDNPLSDEAGHSISGLESVPDRDGEDITTSIKQEVGAMDLETVQEHMEGFRDPSQLETNIAEMQNQGLIMTSLADGLDPAGGKVIRIVSLGDEGQYLTLGDGSQMQILRQELALDSTSASDSYVIQGTETANVTSAPTKARSILSMPANSHLGLSGKSSSMTTSLLTSASNNNSVNTTMSSSANQISGMTQLVALHPGDAGSQPQLLALPQATPLTLSADGLQQYGVLSADGSSTTSELGYQTISVLPAELNQEGMNYVLVMTPQDGDDKQAVAQLVDLKQESQEVREELVEVNGEVKRVLHMMPKKLFSTPTVSGGVNMGTQLMCDYCDYTSPKRYLLTRHMKSHSDERPHKCKECHRGFKTPASLINHVNTHTGTRPHKCKTCDAAFTTSGELVRHIRYRHTFEKPHRCPNCDYASVELSKLKRHMRSHTGERPYKCPHCSYASPDTYKLKRHLRIHTGEKPYECDICHARFTQSNSLKAHKLIHSGNKPVFQCNLCPTTCGRKTDLKIHFNKLHSIGSPLECKKCGQILADRYSFKQHMRTHDMDRCFKCDQCDFIANTERSLDQHAAIHSNGKKYECNLCHMSFNLQQTLEKHSLTCTLDPGLETKLKNKGNGKEKSSEESLHLKPVEKSDPALSVSQEENSNHSSTSKALTGLGADIFPTPVLASDTLHKNLLQDIKAGKLGDVPQVVIVHPDGTLEEIPSASGDKLNLDDIFSALSNTEKQEKGIQSEAIQSASEQEDPGESALEGKGVTTEKSENIDKSEDAGETAQCEASTQAEIESDSDSLDESKASEPVSLNQTDIQETSWADGSSSTVNTDVLNQTSQASSFASEELKSSLLHSNDLAVAITEASSSAMVTSLPSSSSISLPQQPLTLSTVNDSNVNNMVVSSNSNSAIDNPTSSSNNTPQYVVVKGYTCLSEDGNTVQPTLVNVAVDKDSLMKMFASLGPAGDGMGLQLLSGDLEPSPDTGEDPGGRIAQASIIPLHDMTALTGVGDAGAGIAEADDSNLSGIADTETLSTANRDAGLTELCDMGPDSGQCDVTSGKDTAFVSANAFELEESNQNSSSVLSSKDANFNFSNFESSTSKLKTMARKRGEKGEQSGIAGGQGDESSLSSRTDFVREKLSPKEQDEDGKIVTSCVPVKSTSSNCLSHQESSSSSVFSPKKESSKGKQSQYHTSKAIPITDQKVAPPNEMSNNLPEVKMSLSDENLCEPLQLVDVEGPSIFHMSDDNRSVTIQPSFSNTPLGNLFTDSLVEETSNLLPDSAICDITELKEETEIDVCVVATHDFDSETINEIKPEHADVAVDEDLEGTVKTQPKKTKQKGSAKRKASSSPAVDSNLVRTGKRVRKALVKVSM